MGGAEIMQLFRDLPPAEIAEFRSWARANYQPLTPISGIWHPVIQDECRKINQEAGQVFGLAGGEL